MGAKHSEKKNPIHDLVIATDCLLSAWIAFFFFFLRYGGSVVLAHTHTNKTEQNQTHMTVLNRVVNGISSTLGNDISHTHTQDTHSVRRHHPRSTKNKNERKKRRRALIEQGREVSQ